MKIPPDQLAAWFVTVTAERSSDVPGVDHDYAAKAAAHYRRLLSQANGRERTALVAGLKQGINDMLSLCRCDPDEFRARIERALARRGLPSLRKMEAVLKQKHRRIIRRGQIRNDEEFYIVAEILADGDFEISDADRAMLGRLSLAYETHPTRNRPE